MQSGVKLRSISCPFLNLEREKLLFKQNSNRMNLASQVQKKPHKRLIYRAFFLNNGGPAQT